MLIFSKVGEYFYILKVQFLLFHDFFKFQFHLQLETSLILYFTCPLECDILCYLFNIASDLLQWLLLDTVFRCL
jgi:hypothetical protein